MTHREHTEYYISHMIHRNQTRILQQSHDIIVSTRNATSHMTHRKHTEYYNSHVIHRQHT